MAETDHERLAQELEEQTRDLAGRSEELHAQVEEARSDWQAKRADDAVPGAPAPEEPGDRPSSEDEAPAG